MVLYFLIICIREVVAPLVAQRLKHLPAMQETQVQSLRREDALEEEGMTTPPWVFLPGELNGQRILVSYSPWGREESDITACHSFTHDVILHTYFSF